MTNEEAINELLIIQHGSKYITNLPSCDAVLKEMHERKVEAVEMAIEALKGKQNE